MGQRFQFSTRRLFLVTAVVAVWVAVFVGGSQRLSGNSTVSELFSFVGMVLIPVASVGLLTDWIVMALGCFHLKQRLQELLRGIGQVTQTCLTG